MRNKIAGRRLGRTTAHREALIRNMITSLVTHDRIRTTLAKAKELRRHAEKVVTWAKQGESQHHSLVHGFLKSPLAVSKLFKEIAPRYEERSGGYSRVLRAGFRRGDRAPMAILEFVDRPGELRPARRAKSADAVISGRGGKGKDGLAEKPSSGSSALAAEAEATLIKRGNYRRSSVTISHSAPELLGKTLLDRAKEAVERQMEAVNFLKAAKAASGTSTVSKLTNTGGGAGGGTGGQNVVKSSSSMNSSVNQEQLGGNGSGSSSSSQQQQQQRSTTAPILQLQPAFPSPRPSRTRWNDFSEKQKALEAHASLRRAASIAEGAMLRQKGSLPLSNDSQTKSERLQ